MSFFWNPFRPSRMNLVIVFCLATLHSDSGNHDRLNAAWLIAPAHVSQQDPQSKETLKGFTGTWKFSETNAATAQRSQSIENATASLSRFARGRARAKLKKATAPPKEIKIVDSGDQVDFTIGKQKLTIKTDGKPTQIKLESKSATIQAEKRDGKLIVVVSTSEMKRTMTYQHGADTKKLQQQNVFAIKMLDRPIQFTNQYSQK